MNSGKKGDLSSMMVWSFVLLMHRATETPFCEWVVAVYS